MRKLTAATDSSTVERSRRKLLEEFKRQEEKTGTLAQKHGISPDMIKSTLKKGTALPGAEPKLIEADRVRVLEESRRFDQLLQEHPDVRSIALSSRNITVQNGG